jgi:hypothetical protein
MAKTLRVAGYSLAALAILAAAVLGVGSFLWRDSTDYSHVVSIERDEEYQDATLLDRAWNLPVAAAYRRGAFESQSNPSFCGPTSAVDVLRSLGRTAEQATILEGTGVHTVVGLLPGGITLDQLADVLRSKLPRVTVLRNLSLENFRAEVSKSNDRARRYIVNFSRGPLFGRGGGHFSPVGGYLPDKDLVFVLDVNDRFKPWLAKTDRLFSAVDTVDRSSGQKRGLLVIEMP